MPVQPTLQEVIRSAITSRLLDVHVALPGKVESYDASTQTCEVQPTVSRTVVDRDGNKQTEQLPKIANVPVRWSRGGGFFATFPLTKGDHVLLVFQEAATSQWRKSGEVSEPGDLRRHGLGYPVAIPGVAPDADKLADAHATNAVFGLDGDDAQVHITPGGDICIGKGATEKLSRDDRVQAELDKIKSALEGHEHTYVPGNLAPTQTTSNSASYTKGNTAADIVKGK